MFCGPNEFPDGNTISVQTQQLSSLDEIKGPRFIQTPSIQGGRIIFSIHGHGK